MAGRRPGVSRCWRRREATEVRAFRRREGERGREGRWREWICDGEEMVMIDWLVEWLVD